ncbi:MAG: hypothetical protein LW859_36050 [Anabaena sp. 49633_E8]|nr:hypothetical protein [Anabaena sp. 49633_E8]
MVKKVILQKTFKLPIPCSLFPVCQLSVGAKHLEDKLSVIAKNSSPNASPVQLSVVSCQLSVVGCRLSVVGCQLRIFFL